MDQNEKAERFASLHVKGAPIILYNAWDAGSAKAIVKAGAKAVATSSWAVADALGYEDGENTPKALVERIVAGIVEAVQVPTTVDFEGGYSEDNEDLAENVDRLLHIGVIGINFEDRIVEGAGLYHTDRQARRIAAIRRAADHRAIELFINARTDLFLGSKEEDHAKFVDEAIDRARAYADAGASGFFIPGLRQESLIERVCERVMLPINVMFLVGISPYIRLAVLGVARVSYVKVPYCRAMDAVQYDARKILA